MGDGLLHEKRQLDRRGDGLTDRKKKKEGRADRQRDKQDNANIRFSKLYNENA